MHARALPDANTKRAACVTAAHGFCPGAHRELYSNEQDVNNILNSVTKSTTVRGDYRAAGMFTSKGASLIHFTFHADGIANLSLSCSLFAALSEAI